MGLDLGVAGAGAGAAGFGLGFALEAKHSSQFQQQLALIHQIWCPGLSGGAAITALQSIGQGAQGLGQLKQHRQGGGGVEVVVHCGGEARTGGRKIRGAGGGGGAKRQRACQAQGGVEALPAGGGGLKGVGAEVERLAVVGLEGEQTQCHRRDAGIEQGADGGEVAQGFGHLLAAHIDHAVVQPIAGQLVAAGCLRLGNFVFVVGKDQVGATEVDVDRVAELLAHHR